MSDSAVEDVKETVEEHVPGGNGDQGLARKLLIPAAAVYAVYRAYVTERQRHEKLEFLYEANRALSRSPEVAEAIEGVLARSREAFRSEIAEVVLFLVDPRSSYVNGTVVVANGGERSALPL